jgi:hypothetical protein
MYIRNIAMFIIHTHFSVHLIAHRMVAELFAFCWEHLALITNSLHSICLHMHA